MRDWLDHLAEEQRSQFFLWVPVLIGAGIGVYFTQRREPSLPLAVLLPLLAVWAWACTQVRRVFFRALLYLGLFVSLGYGLGSFPRGMLVIKVET